LGFSLSAATAIIGVGIVISLELIVSTTIPTITDVHDSYDIMRDRSIDLLQTNINISKIETSINGSNHDINITVRNTGSTTLKTNKFEILINGTCEQFYCASSYIYPENSVIFRLYNIRGSGTRRVKVVTNNGISDYREYNI